MKAWIQAATFLVASTYGLALPPAKPATSNLPPHAIDVAGPTDTHGIAFYDSISCSGCFAGTTKDLDIDLIIEPSAQPCQPSTIILNDVRLSHAQSPAVIRAKSTDWPSAHEVLVSWTLSCLNDSVTLLSVQVEEVLGFGKPMSASGFAASFRQATSPEFLRTESAPLHPIDKDVQRFTMALGSGEIMVVPAPAIVAENVPDELQEQLRRLHQIKAHIGRLHHKYMRQEHLIFEMIKQDFAACQGPSCYFHTAVEKAPHFFELVKAHFKHRPDWAKIRAHSATQGIKKQGDASIMYGGHRDAYPPPNEPPPAPSEDDFAPPPPEDNLPPPPPPFFDFDQGYPPPPRPPLPPPAPPPPEEDISSAPHITGQYHGRPTPPPWSKHPGHHKHHRPHNAYYHGRHRHLFYFSLGSIFFFIVVASLLFKCLQAKTGLFRNDRRKRDRAARREECRNRAAYRRAAIRHRWQRWWSQFRQSESTADYEEKRSRIIAQEEALEDVMQSEIRGLRRAHEMVDDIVRAEDTRQRLHHEANFGQSSAAATPPDYGLRRQNTESSQATDTTLPLYQPPPPSYDQELEGELTVVDGFMYTPSTSDHTPDSSVVDCTPRMSFETSTTVTKA